jgi:sortase B
MKKRYTVLILTAILTAAALAAVGFYMKKSGGDDSAQAEEYEKITSAYSDLKPTVTDDSAEENGETEQIKYLADCQAQNPDAVAWLTIPDTAIDFPIVQTDDNEYYLHYSFEKKKSIYGVPFLDYRCTRDFSDFNSIIYGHNISNKYVFAGLLNFRNQSYFDARPYAELTTESAKYRINFIACLVVESDGFIYSTVFPAKKDRQLYVKTIEEKAVCKRDYGEIDLSEERLVALSTCSNDYENARTVLIGYLEEI